MIGASAILSDCGTYRYELRRQWTDGPVMTFIMLNPSTADASADDPTIRKCIGFAKRNAYGGIRVVNLFAYRSHSPANLKKMAREQGFRFVNGPENDDYIFQAASAAKRDKTHLVAAWGVHGKLLNRASNLAIRLADQGYQLYTLNLNVNGSPAHPLMLPYTSLLSAFYAE